VSGIAAELVVYMCVPVLVVAIAFAVPRVRSRSLLDALPFVLFWTSIVYPAVSSKGFQAVAKCDCFSLTNGVNSTLRCYLPADSSHHCPTEHASVEVLTLGSAAIAIYGLGVPLTYASLLFSARSEIRKQHHPPGSFAEALTFLHGALEARVFWWPLVDASRTLVLTGLLALLAPGQLIQIFAAIVFAMGYMAVQIWSQPYRMRSNNLLAFGANMALLLHLLSSLGVQFNAKYDGEVLDPIVLSVMLFVAGTAIIGVTLLGFCFALCHESRTDSADTNDAAAIAPLVSAPVRRRSLLYITTAFSSRSRTRAAAVSTAAEELLAEESRQAAINSP
jgi:hypothetical protein